MTDEAKNSKFSHDLRNSLSVIYTNAQILEFMLDKPETQKELEIVRSIHEASKKMTALIKLHEEDTRQAKDPLGSSHIAEGDE